MGQLRLGISLILICGLVPLTAAAQSQLRGVTVSSNITVDDIEDLADWNPNYVRYLLSWGETADIATEAEYFAWLESALQHLDSLLPTFAHHNMNVMVVLYSPPGGHINHNPPWPLHRVFVEKWAQDALIRAWAIVATRYRDNPTVYGFDILNEPAHAPRGKLLPGVRIPRSVKKWDKLGPFLTKFLLTVAPYKNVVMEPLYSLPQFLSKVKIIKDPRVKYSIHSYEPFFFTHQGLYGIPLGFTYPDAVHNIFTLQAQLAPVDKFMKKVQRALKRFVPPQNIGQYMILGEMSVVRWAPEQSVNSYLSDMISICEARGWTWVYHAFRESSIWSAEHTTNINDPNPSPMMTSREVLLRQAFSLNQ